MEHPVRTPPRVKVGVSACLLGEPVRYDGGHKRDDYVAGTLSRWFELVAVCPEVEAGLGAPRPPMRLVASVAGARLIVEDGADLTDRMREFAASRAARLGDLRGFVFKARSPSCGPAAPVEGGDPMPGLFAEAMLARVPGLPVIDEEGLSDARRRDEFVERVLAFDRRAAAR